MRLAMWASWGDLPGGYISPHTIFVKLSENMLDNLLGLVVGLEPARRTLTTCGVSGAEGRAGVEGGSIRGKRSGPPRSELASLARGPQ